MPPENDYFPVVDKGLRVFLPIHCVQKEVSRKVDNQHSDINSNDYEVKHLGNEADSNDEYDDALTDQPLDGIVSESTFYKHDSEDKKDYSHGSQMYEILLVPCNYRYILVLLIHTT